jgi:hypothetical protein
LLCLSFRYSNRSFTMIHFNPYYTNGNGSSNGDSPALPTEYVEDADTAQNDVEGSLVNKFDREYLVRRSVWSTNLLLAQLLNDQPGERSLKHYLRDVALDVLEHEDPRLYLTVIENKTIIDWGIETGVGDQITIRLYLVGIKKTLMADVTQAALELFDGNKPRDEYAIDKVRYLRRLANTNP